MRKPFTTQPHLVGVEETLRERPGVVLIALMTDEAGALMLRGGEVPEYIKLQCQDALDWLATDYRAVVRGTPVS